MSLMKNIIMDIINLVMIMIDYMLIGKRIKTARKEVNITQEKLSELLGITPEHLSRLERGVTNAGLEIIAKIAENLSVEPEKLLFGAISSSQFYQKPELDELLKKCSPEKINIIVQIAKMISELK